MTGQTEFSLEFSRPFALDDIASDSSAVDLEATDDERRKLAERFGLLSLDRLVAHLTLTRGASGIPVRVRGTLEASVVQECVVSLEPVSSDIKEMIDVEYAPPSADGEEEPLGLDEPEPPEPLEGDRLELGELVAQHLAVAIDPYPRKEGAAPPEWADTGPGKGAEARENPFSVLAGLRKKRP